MYANLLVAVVLSAQLGQVESEYRSDDGSSKERMANQLREQAERIERLEGEVRRLRVAMERIARGSTEHEQPPRREISGGDSERRVREMQNALSERARGAGDAEERVRSLEQILAQLKKRAQQQRSGDAEVERRGEERAAARRREAEERQQFTQEVAHQLEQFRTKRAEAKRNYEQQRASVTREMKQALERLEQGFQQADQGMARAIAELEQRLARLRRDGELEGREERQQRR